VFADKLKRNCYFPSETARLAAKVPQGFSHTSQNLVHKNEKINLLFTAVSTGRGETTAALTLSVNAL
jgi:hypothetical protein